ncbi:MAG: SPFH domain-containing protein [Deltaproteobacteria bacterium]|nr:SPFH domain-containing protein [Deltaproteobacteria bacterium]
MAIVDVVKFNGAPDTFAWKFPSQELGTWTQLIVNESQEAILFKGGKAMDIFGSGRHTLSTGNIPLLNNIINLPFGGRSPFTAEVWYINKLYTLDIKWGTASPIQIQDPKYGILTPVRAFGLFGVRIDDSRKFLVKLVGTMSSFDKDSLIRYFRGVYVAKAKDSISSYLVHKKISIVEINAYLDELSEYIKERVKPVLAGYGIELINFYVNDVNVPEDDPAVVQLKSALAKRAEMNIIGYDYRQERSFDTLEGAATNTGSAASGLLGAGMGLGMGVGIGGAVGGQFGGMGQILTTASSPGVPCPKCGSVVPQASRFCPACGRAVSNEQENDLPKCDKCGAPIPKGAKFCPECGDMYNPCPKCGSDLHADDTRCRHCGFALPQKCPSCGESVKDGDARFCPNCGAALKKKCAFCQAELSAAEKFCPSCGKKTTPDQQGN